MVGPESGDNIWPEVIRKHATRVGQIRCLGLGIPLSTAFYNRAAFTTLGYVGSMVFPPQSCQTRVEADVQQLTPSPIWAIPKEVLYNLNECGLGPNIRQLSAVCAP